MFTEKKNRGESIATYIAIIKISFHSIKSNSCERYGKLKPNSVDAVLMFHFLWSSPAGKGERLPFSFLNGMAQITAASALSLSVLLKIHPYK